MVSYSSYVSPCSQQKDVLTCFARRKYVYWAKKGAG